jgi:hypothetical protein
VWQLPTVFSTVTCCTGFSLGYTSVSQPPDRERPEETTIWYKISLVQLINNWNIILYLSTCHTLYISVLTLFMIMPKLIINTYVSLMYELKKNLERYLPVNLLGSGPRLIKKRIYRAAVSQRLRNTGLYYLGLCKYMFAQWRNRLTLHFSEHIPIIKRCISVLLILSLL